MSADIFIVCEQTKTYVPLANLGAGNFNYNNYMRDRNCKSTGPFIGQNIDLYDLKIVRKEEIPSDFNLWEGSSVPKTERSLSNIRYFFEGTENPYTVLAELHGDYVVEFHIYEGIDPNIDLEPLMVGSIKWDGCSNWHFPYSYYPLHFCGKEKTQQFNDLLLRLYDWADELMPSTKNYRD